MKVQVPGSSDRFLILDYARRALGIAVRTGAPDPFPPSDGPFALPAAPFVTLRKRADGALRGCIGRIAAAEPLGQALATMAAAAALEDPRFPPVEEGELEGLDLQVTLLGPFLPAPDLPSGLQIGIHGLRIEHRGLSGLLLPQVAPDHGLDAAGFLAAVCRKAGLPADAWREEGARVEVFTAEAIHSS